MGEQIISIAKACGMLEIGSQTLYRWNKKGLVRLIPSQQAGIPLAEVERLLSEREGMKSDEA